MEIFEQIPIDNFRNYEISNLGRVRNIKSGRIMKLCRRKNGYLFLRVKFEGNKFNYLVHRLVMLTFNPEGKDKGIVNHINNIRDDNRLENLEWCTPKENSERKINNKSSKIRLLQIYNSKKWDSVEDFVLELLKKMY